MRKTLACIALLLAAPALAQTATLTTPETVTATTARCVGASFTPTSGTVTVEYITAASAVKRTQVYSTTSQTELNSLVTAMETVRATETGGSLRKMQFCVLGWMFDNGAFRDEAGNPIAVTVAP